MSTINFKFKFGKLDKVKSQMQKVTRDLSNEFYAEAVRHFISGVMENTKIDTGMSIASLLSLAGKVNYVAEVENYINSNRKRGSKKGLMTFTGEYRKNKFRGIAEGMIAGRKAYRLIWTTLNDQDFFFHFGIKVFQMNFWEIEQHALAHGREEMLDYIKSNKKSFEQKLGRLYRKITGSYLRGV